MASSSSREGVWRASLKPAAPQPIAWAHWTDYERIHDGRVAIARSWQLLHDADRTLAASGYLRGVRH